VEELVHELKTDYTIAITDYYYCSKAKSTTTFGDFSHPVECYHFVFELGL
jgi:hypothetical protein